MSSSSPATGSLLVRRCLMPATNPSTSPCRKTHTTMLATAALCRPYDDHHHHHAHRLASTNSCSATSTALLACNYQLDLPTVTSAFPLLPPAGDTDEDADPIWASLRHEAHLDSESEPALSALYRAVVLDHPSLESALSSYLATKLSGTMVNAGVLSGVFAEVMAKDPEIGRSMRSDLTAARDRDPACSRMVHCFLYYKGFLALQTHRVAHRLWVDDRKALALFLQGRSSEVFAVDIHPGAMIGAGILLDHATGVVIGETAVVGDRVSILHNVTLGGTGKEGGDRHPKIGDGVLVGAGTHILGNVRVGEGAKVGAGSVVLKEVPPKTTAVGNPAKLVGGPKAPLKNEGVPSLTMDHTSWSDYVI